MLKNGTWRLMSQVIVMFFSLISSIIITRILGPENKGHYAVVNLTVTLVFVCGYLGLNQAITYHRSQKTYQDHHLWTFLVFFGVIWGIILGAIGFFLANFVLEDILGLNHISKLFLSFGLLLIFSRLLNAYLYAYILGGKQFTTFNKLEIFNSALSLILLLFIALIDNATLAIYYAWILNPIIMSALLLSKTKNRWSLREISIKKIFTETFNYGYKAYITNFMQFFNYQLDQYVLNYFRGPAEVGVYTVAVSLGGYLWQLSNAAQTIIFPSVSNLSVDEVKNVTCRANRNTLFLSAVGAGLIILSGYWLISRIYGEDFIGAYPALIWLLPGIVTFSIVKVLTASLAGLGHPEAASIVTAITMLFTLFLDFFWIPDRGIIGAAQASTVAYSIGGVLSIIIFRRYLKVSLKQLLVIQSEDIQMYKHILKRIVRLVSSRRI